MRHWHISVAVGVGAGLLLLLMLHQVRGVSPGGIGSLLLFDSAEPRIVMSLLCGAALGLSGAVLQAVLRNPIAEPTTLGTAVGAQLGVTMATLWLPWMPWFGREAAAAIGALAATALSCALVWRRGLSPLHLILSGLVVSLFCGAVSAILALLRTEQLSAVFLWNTGSLLQYDWSGVHVLLPQVLIAGGLLFLLVRAIGILALDDGTAQGLGVSTNGLRLATVGLAVILAAAVVSTVGVIGFVGLAAPVLARLGGARQLRAQMRWAPPVGAWLLCFTDQILQLVGHTAGMLPTGTATAILGAPLLLVLLPRLREAPALRPGRLQGRYTGHTNGRFLGLIGLLCTTSAIALGLGHSGHGWELGLGIHHALLRWRWPRVLASLSAGMVLGTAGAILQRLTGNALASPEILGLSSGSIAGVILAIFLFGMVGRIEMLGAATLGGLAVLGLLLLVARRSGYSPHRFALAGIAVTTVMSALTPLLLASGDVRMRMLQSWLSGSTYLVTAPLAVSGALLGAVLLVIVPLLARPLSILPLGGTTASAVGHNTGKGRLSLLVVASALTAVGTLIVGPLTFVGLLGPQAAGACGFRRPVAHVIAAGMLGGLIMVAADFLGRNLLFPYQLPEGLLACLAGAPVLLWSLSRSR